jgi:hypothetical protein
LKRYKSPGSDQIPAELIQGRGEILRSMIHKLVNSVWKMEELPQQWKESIIVPIHKKGYKVDSSNYGGISLLSPSYKIVSNILLSRLSPYLDEIIIRPQETLCITNTPRGKITQYTNFVTVTVL